MNIKELIIQQYSSYDNEGNCNIHLDGNLNITLHAIVLDIVSVLSKASTLFSGNIHLDYVITIPDTSNGVNIIEKITEGIGNTFSTDNISFSITLYRCYAYYDHVTTNRKKGNEIFTDILSYDKGEFIQQFHSIETNFEKSIDNQNIDLLMQWLLEYKTLISPYNRRKLTTRLNVSKHSLNDNRESLNGLESHIATLISISDTITFNNKAQIDYINSYCPGLNQDKLKLGSDVTHVGGMVRNGVIFSKLFFNMQMDTYRIRNAEFIQNLVNYFTDNEIKYLFPFRLTDPDWGYGKLSDEEKRHTVVTNPTNTPNYKSDEYNSSQPVYDRLTEYYDKRSILFTLYYLISKGYIGILIPLYSDMFNIMHQTTAELFYFIPEAVDIRFDIKTRELYLEKYNSLILENVIK